MMGLRSGSYGVWASKPGVEVTTAVDQDLLFGLSMGMLIPYMTGTISFTQNSTTPQAVTHSLGYRPLVLVQGSPTTPPSVGGGAMDFQIKVTTTQLEFNPLTGTAASVYRYVIYARNAAD